MIPRWIKELPVPGALAGGLFYAWKGGLPVGASIADTIHSQATEWLLVNTKYPIAVPFLIGAAIAYTICRFGIWWFYRRPQKLLDDISNLRTELSRLRIEIEQNFGVPHFDLKNWEDRVDLVQGKIAAKIEKFSTKAEANIYRTRGNIQRLVTSKGTMAFPVYRDICVHDLDYLKQFIVDYSRNKERKI